MLDISRLEAMEHLDFVFHLPYIVAAVVVLDGQMGVPGFPSCRAGSLSRVTEGKVHLESEAGGYKYVQSSPC